MGDGPAFFIDSVKGDDQQDGSQQRPWRTLNRVLGQKQGGPLKPGDTLYLRGGTYYEPFLVRVSGTGEKPITIRSYAGELAILDGGLRGFYEDPTKSWEPSPQGADGEFRSTKSYDFGGGFGNFGDSMVPFHRYINLTDLRSANELYHPGLSNRTDDPVGIYAGPGVRRDLETGRIHIRLAHSARRSWGECLSGRGRPSQTASGDFRTRVCRANRGCEPFAVTGSRDSRWPAIALRIADSEQIELEGMTLYGSQMALRASGVRGLRLMDSALRGHAAPWHSRFHHKNRAGSGYLILAEGSNTDWEIAHSELTDHHDCIAFQL